MTTTPRVLDLFSGLGGWSAPWRAAGAQVVTLDFAPRFGADHVRDILTVGDLAELERSEPFGVILASPPCEAFSVAAMGRNWRRSADGGIAGPKHPDAELGLAIAAHTFALVDAYVTRALFQRERRVAYVIENPIGALRVAPCARLRRDRVSTWYCRWGETRAKPTDLWTNLGGPWPMCHAGAADHERAPRGARTGTQGIRTAAARSLIPAALAREVMRRATV
jgi:hypothetical protein